MATWVLTPKSPNQLTGFANPILGWQLSAATALDVFVGCNTVYYAGWVSQLGPMSGDVLPPIWQLVIKKGPSAILVNDTDYFVFDGLNVWSIPLATVQAEYTVTAQ